MASHSNAFTSAAELSNAITELEQFRPQFQHPKNQQFIDEQLRQWRITLDEMNRRELLANGSNSDSSNAASKSTLRPSKKLATYAFDESDKFLKLYYTVPGISKAPADCFNAKFNENSFEVHCTNVNGVDYEINVQGLFKEIVPDKCQVKQKSDDLLLVMMKKAEEHQKWGSLLKLEQKESKKVPKMDEEEDPQAGLMKLMKQMYDDGDDEMKRTIRKSWHEAQTKKDNLGAGGLGDF